MFKLIKIENGRMNVPEPEYHVANAALECGQAVSLSSGELVKNTTAPTHITLASAKANDAKVPCVRIEPAQVYEVPVSATPTASVGTKVALGTDGITVAGSASESGIATVVSLDGAKAAGDKITVRFN